MSREALYEEYLDYLETGLLEDYDTEFEEEAETPRDTSCVTPGNPYILHCFPAHETELTLLHRQHLDRIAAEILRSFGGSRPITRVKIVGHAATWWGISKAEYGRRALERAENARAQLRGRLANAGLGGQVEITVEHRANDKPLVDNVVNSSSSAARHNRALNRRVEIELIRVRRPAKKKKKIRKPRMPKTTVVRIRRKCCREEHKKNIDLHIMRAVRASRLAANRFRELASMSEAERAESWNNGQEKVWFGSYNRGKRKTPFKYVKRNIDNIRRIFLSKNPNLTVQCYYDNDAPYIDRGDRAECLKCRQGFDCVNEPFDPKVATFGFTCTCQPRTFLNPMHNALEPPPYTMYLTNSWFYRPQGLSTEVWRRNRSNTIIHEVAHLAGALRLFEEKVGERVAKRLARRNPWGARVNADNYAFYIMSLL